MQRSDRCAKVFMFLCFYVQKQISMVWKTAVAVDRFQRPKTGCVRLQFDLKPQRVCYLSAFKAEARSVNFSNDTQQGEILYSLATRLLLILLSHTRC